jgi:hypothetical protein
MGMFQQVLALIHVLYVTHRPIYIDTICLHATQQSTWPGHLQVSIGSENRRCFSF